ncbi:MULTISPECIES: LuxR C-terminal-related transcriptional regulator [unclassified Streptomyces]|uniref:helix-turn-helix domain-containing protein n=1 Tax=unclassified Streptomyces TaxID=2593676 RepID=UPI0036E60D5D
MPTVSTTRLTPRQRDVARHLADGLHAAEVADELNLSLATVRQYKTAAGHRLGVSGAPALVEAAYESGDLDQPDPDPEAGKALACLPDVQRKVLALRAQGMGVQEIADHLSRPVHVVRKDVRALMAALGAKTPAHAITRARQLGLLGVPNAGRSS